MSKRERPPHLPNGGGARKLGNPFVWAIAGFAAAMIFCEFTWVQPLRAQLDAREKSLLEWERINRQEREAIATMKTITIEELRKWVATVDEQNQRYGELLRRLHQQEVELTGPATSLLLIAASVLVAVVALVVFWLRDANAVAATTLENVVALAPDEMLRSLIVAGMATREPITVVVEEKPRPAALPPVAATEAAPSAGALREGGVDSGAVVLLVPDERTGFIQPDGRLDRLRFHFDDVSPSDRARLAVGARALSTCDRQGGPAGHHRAPGRRITGPRHAPGTVTAKG